MSAALRETWLNLAAHPILWPMIRLARKVGPVWNVPGLGLLVSDAEVGRDILQRDDEFPKNGPGSFAQAFTSVLGPAALVNMDGPEHRQLRTEVASVLTPPKAEEFVRRRAATLEALRAALLRGEHVDLVQFTNGWSGRIAFDVVGVDPPLGKEEEAGHDLVRCSRRIASLLGFGAPSARQLRVAQAECARLARYFQDAYHRPAAPASLAGRLQELGLSFEQALGLLLIFVIAGTLTVAAAIPRVVALLLDSGQLQRLAQHPEWIAGAVSEGLRFTTPLPVTVRIVRRDTTVGGHKLMAGSRIIVLTCNLARDPNLFPDPDRFDVERTHDRRSRHLWFGTGTHYCVGFSLAEREIAAVIEALVADGQALRIVSRRPAAGGLLPAYGRLVIRASGQRLG